MPLSEEEVQSINTQISEGKEVSEIDLLKPLSGWTIRTKEQETSFRERHKSEVIAEKTKEIHSQYDADIKSVTGQEKKPDEKTYDFNKRIMSDLKTKADGATDQINTLKEQIEGEGAGVLKKEIETLNTKYTTDMSAKDNELTSLQQKTVSQGKLRIIDQKYLELQKTFKTETPVYFDQHKKSVFEGILQNSQLTEDGADIMLLDKNGSVRKDANFKNLSIDGYLKEMFKDVIQEGAGAGGAGGGLPPNTKVPDPNNPNPPPPTGNPWDGINVPDEIKTQEQLHTWMKKEHGERLDRKQFTKAFLHLADEKKLDLR